MSAYPRMAHSRLTLAPGRCGCNMKLIIFKLISRIAILSICYEIAFMWMPQDLANDKSTLFQVMAWCPQTTSHYLCQCWPRSMSPYDVNRTQWVKQEIDKKSTSWRTLLFLYQQVWWTQNLLDTALHAKINFTTPCHEHWAIKVIAIDTRGNFISYWINCR